MIQRVLSFDDAPPLSGPLRFFLTAPLFALAAAAALFWYGDAALESRWAMSTLALTHMLTLGFLAMVMCGALLQILPVVAGVLIPRPALTATMVHMALTAGTALLVSGFAFAEPLLFRWSGPVLGLAFLWLLAAAAPGLLRGIPEGAAATVTGIRLALCSLAVTVLLGIALAASLGWSLPLALLKLTDLHAAWGLLGWVGLLVIGVAFQVIPMFQSTPPYPLWVSRLLPPALWLVLAARSMAAGWPGWLQTSLSILAALLLAGFALLTLNLLRQRKRANADATTMFWRLAQASLVLCAIVHMAPWSRDEPARALLLGMLFIVGFAGSAVSGMLYKIVPFLLWYDLQSRPGMDRKTMPGIRALLPDRAAKQQFWLHLAALALLVAATLAPQLLARVAAAAFGLSSLQLWLNLVRAWLAHRRVTAQRSSALVTP